MKPILPRVTVAAVASICIAVGGCALLSPPETRIEKSVLNQLPGEPPHRATGGATVLVFPPTTAPVYDTVRIAYRTHPREIAYFREREWGATPSQMIYPLLVRTLENTHSFEAVLVPPYTGRYTYALRTEVLELIQDFTPQSATLVLSLRFQLTGYGANRVIATRNVSLREPMLQRNSHAGVVAANEATAKALEQMAEFVLEKVAAPAKGKAMSRGPGASSSE